MKTLVIGYGNDSRNDDGIGWYVVAKLQQRALPAVEYLTAHQLEVDLVEEISRYDRVVFVDAALPDDSRAWQRTELTPQYRLHAVSHFLSPGDLLGLCRALKGRCPKGLLYSIRGYDFDFGTQPTRAARQAAEEVVRQIVLELQA